MQANQQYFLQEDSWPKGINLFVCLFFSSRSSLSLSYWAKCEWLFRLSCSNIFNLIIRWSEEKSLIRTSGWWGELIYFSILLLSQVSEITCTSFGTCFSCFLWFSGTSMAEQSVSQGFFIFQTLTCLFSIDIDLIFACPWNPWSFAILEMKREM